MLEKWAKSKHYTRLNKLKKNHLKYSVYSFKDCLSDIEQDLVFYGGKTPWNKIVVILFNISFKLMFWYRICRYCHLKSNICGRFIIVIRFWQYILGGNEIDHRAKLGHRILLAHPSGIIIGGGVVIEDDVTIFQQTTFGSHGREGESKSYPLVKSGCTIYAGAKIIGGITIYENSTIGANSVVLIDVPKNTTAVGVPARIID